MAWLVLAFASGVWCLQQQPELPASSLTLGASGVAGMLLLLAWRWSRTRTLAMLLAAALLGFGYAAWRADQRLHDQLPQALEGEDIVVSGVISGMPQKIERGWRFDFDVDSPVDVPRRISLAWYSSGLRGEVAPRVVPPLHAGDRWQLTVRLKRPHGNANPHGFDFEAWLFQRGVRATGYVRPKAEQVLIGRAAAYFVERQREDIRGRFLDLLGEREYGGVLVALAIGDQQAIPREQWDVFGRTGLTHLMSISGLHITMLAGLAYAISSALWRRSPRLVLYLPAQQAALAIGLACAAAYTLLAGFAIPAQRTLFMLAVVAIVLWQRRHVAFPVVLSWALMLVIVIDPWAVLSAGFWLSFAAVALLFYVGSGRIARSHWLLDWLRAQWALTLGMIPLLLALFQMFSLVSPVANALAIPVLSLVVTPLTLLATIPGLEFLLLPAHDILALLMLAVNWLAGLPHVSWQQAAQPAHFTLLAVAGVLWLLLPRGFPARWLGLVPVVLLLMLPAPRPAPGELNVTTLDVGQGLAVHVQTAAHDLLFDTGPAYSEEANSGNRIILPYLRAMGVTRLEGLVVSHADNDHAGGAESIVEALPVDWMLSSAPLEHHLSALPIAQQPCVNGMRWSWDGVSFDMLHPAASDYESAGRSNDMSCVLRISSPHGSILLTGDIEARSERKLLARNAQIKADVLLAPHHGSKTSSTPAFIGAVGAHTVIFPVGYRNSFRHPHPDVLARYAGTPAIYRSDHDGAVIVRYSKGTMNIATTRAWQQRYWHGQ